MNRRDFLSGATACIAGSALARVGGNPPAKPNILMLPVDDLKPLLGCYAHKEIMTPNIDRLAARGTVFLNNCCQQAVCGPTRASLMTGLYPDSTGVWDLKTRMRDVHPNVLAMPEYFIRQGYETTGIGKTYDSRCVDKKADEPSWSIRYGSEQLQYGKDVPRPAGGYHHPDTRAALKRGYVAIKGRTFKSGSGRNRALGEAAGPMAKPATECMDVPDTAYPDGALADAGCRLLERLAAGDKPFFLSVGFYKPHLPFVAPKKYWDMYDPAEIRIHPFQQHAENGPELAYHTSGELRSYTDMPNQGDFDPDTQVRLIHGYRACVTYIDAQIGKLLDKLEALDIADSTIVCLWGDHGWHLGDHAMWCKHSNFEQAVKAPLIISAPGQRSGVKTDAPTGFVDIFPTFCELAGVPVPAATQGKSLVPLMKDPEGSVRDAILSQYPRSIDGKPVMGYTLRDRHYRYVKWLQLNYRGGERKGLLVARELYDYRNDPHERVNQAGNETFAGVVARFESLFAKTGVAQHTGKYVSPTKVATIHGMGGISFNGMGSYLDSRSVKVNGQPFTNALEVEVTRVPDRRSQAAYKRPVMIPLAAGKTYRISFSCRSDEGAELHAILQKNGAPYTRICYQVVKATKAWQRIEIIGEPKEAYTPPDGAVLTCHVGGLKQTVQFADVRIEELP